MTAQLQGAHLILLMPVAERSTNIKIMIRDGEGREPDSHMENPYRRRGPRLQETPLAIHTIDDPNRQTLSTAQAQWQTLFRQYGTANDSGTSGDVNRPIVLTAFNRRRNHVWGDKLSEKAPTITRVYSLNVNGLRLDRRGGQFDDLCKMSKETQADIMCCQEHNLDTTQTQVRSILYDTMRHHWPRNRITLGTSPIPFTSMFKPGGTMIMATNSITSRMVGQTIDKWGRWVSQTYRGREARRITVISVYQVVAKTSRVGTSTADAQQRSLLLKTQDAVTDPRKAFKRDLRVFVQECLNEEHELLLVGDFNESIGSEIDGISKLAADMNLIDLMKFRHTTQQSPATYSRGKTRLDYGLATQRIANAMTKCGYEPFNSRFPTDHRAYYFDFSTDQLFGSETQILANPASRMLKSNNVEQVTQYIQTTYDLMANRNVFARAERLSLPGNRHAHLERLDKDVVKASLDAEKQTKHFREPAWSVELAKARQTVSILKKCLSSSRTGLDHSHIVSHDVQRRGLDILLPTTTHECSIQLRIAQKSVKEIIKRSFQRRDDERNERIKALEESGKKADKDHAKVLRRLRRAELIKLLFEKLKAQRARGHRSGVTRIEIPVHPSEDPKTCTEWQTIDVPDEIVQHIQSRNRKHFGQADGTPFTRAPLSTDIGFCGDGQGAEEILLGQYQSHPLAPQVQILLQHLQLNDEMAQLQSFPTISMEELTGKLKAWRETTTTSPSGMHLGHYKSLLARHKYSNAEEEQDTSQSDSDTSSGPTDYALKLEYDRMQQAILRVHLLILNYALERGYSLNRWKTVANTILFKEPGNVKIHRTRVIHIYEADYNLVLGLKWRMALYQAEALQQLNDGQYGSRPRRNAVDPVMIEELQFEISRATRKTLIQTNYDATSCYDRIIPNLAMIASRRFGVHKEVALMNARTLQSAQYHIRTDLGLSPTSYQHEDHMPIYGTGQGSGNSPMIWCFISSLLFDCYAKSAYQAFYCNPDGTNSINIHMIGFVDDSNGQVNLFQHDESPDSLQQLIQKAEHNASTWSKLLGATGGSLELSKCSYHVMNWQFSVQGAPVLGSVKSRAPQISVNDPFTGESQDLEYLPPSVAHKTLGHFKEPTGSQRTQFTQLKAKSDKATEFLWTTHLTRQEAWTFYHSCYLPSVSYPLTSSFLTEMQLDKIQQKAMTIIYAKCGFNRHTKRAVLYGPHEFGGAGFSRLYVNQGIAQTKYFIRHWRLQSTVRKLFQCALSWFHLATGMSFSLLDRVHVPLPQLESKWLASLRGFLATINASIQVDNPRIPPRQREGDVYLMDKITEANIFTNAEIRKLNYCRLFLQVVTLSDIAKPNGEELDPSILDGAPSLMSSQTKLMHINQDRPSETEWKLWKKANLLWSDSQGRLLHPLAKWLCSVQDQRQHHFAYFHHRTLFLRANDASYIIYRVTRQSMYHKSSHRPCTIHQIPPQAIPVEVRSTDRGLWQVHGNYHSIERPQVFPQSTIATFHQYVMTLSPWEIELLQHVRLELDPRALCVALESTFRAVSDGSVRYNKHGAYGWVLSSRSGERVAYGMGPASGRIPTSYRAEAYGMLSLMRFLIRIREYSAMHEEWAGKIGTDSKSVLDTLRDGDHDPQEEETPINLDGNTVVLDALRPDWDVLIEIQDAMQELPNVSLSYVKGHQDREKRYETLNLMGQLNVNADHEASVFQDTHGRSRPIVLMSPLTRAHLHLSDGTVTGNYDQHLRYVATTKPLLEYIQERYRWTPSIMDSIHWVAHGNALKKQYSRRTHMVKLLHEILPTTGHANKFDKGRRQCPLCPSLHEDRDHILCCPHSSRMTWRDKFLRDLRDHCIISDTDPILQGLLCNSLREWFRMPQDYIQQQDDFNPSLHRLISQQNRIGWRQIFNGRFSIEWVRLQDIHFNRIRGQPADTNGSSAYTGERWLTNLILFVWDKWYTLWKQRNLELHGHDANTRAAAESNEVRRQLRDIYEHKHQLEPSVQELLFAEVEQHYARPTMVTKNWLAIHTGLIRDSIRRVQTKAIQGVRSIRSYFAPIR